MLTLSVVLVGCAGDLDRPDDREILSQADRDVYHAILSEESLHYHILPKPGDAGPGLVGDYLVVLSETKTSPVPLGSFLDESGEPRGWLSEYFPQLSRECLDSFISANRDSSVVLPQLSATLPVVMLDEAGFSALKAGGKLWPNFWTQYPEAVALVHLSVIGYDPSGRQALVYLHGRRGSLSGRSHLVFLMKEQDWSIAVSRQVLVN